MWAVRARIIAGGAHYSLVTNVQLYIAIGVPMLFNAALIGLVVRLINSHVDARFGTVEARFQAIEARLDAMNARFDDMRDLWRAELRRVEEVLDSRLKHLEAR